MSNDSTPIFDKLVTPLLSEISKICKDNGIPFAAAFEYKDGCFSLSVIQGTNPSVIMRKIQAEVHRIAETGEQPLSIDPLLN